MKYACIYLVGECVEVDRVYEFVEWMIVCLHCIGTHPRYFKVSSKV